MDKIPSAFQIDALDNVATVLTRVIKGDVVNLTGECGEKEIQAATDIPQGHKIALIDIGKDENIIKYGVVIGKSTENIYKGSWVHLHVMQSIYDRRSSHLDVVSGAPKDTKYE